MPINTCILGYGLSARTFQIPYIQLLPQFHLHSILQRTPTADNNAAQDHPGVKVYNNINDVCADPEIQLVIVSVANSVHYSITKQLLEAGKDVVVEKPFTVKAEEADELCQLAREKNRVLTVFQSMYLLFPS
jgi:predicted dehydrogenase